MQCAHRQGHGLDEMPPPQRAAPRGATPTLSRVTTDQHRGGLRDRMLQIGLELAAAGGQDAVGIREITRRAGVTPAAAYRHFRDQQELREKVAREIDITLRQRIADAVTATAGSARDRVVAAAHAYIDFAFVQPNLFIYVNAGFQLSSNGSVFESFVDLVHALGVEQTGGDPTRERAEEVAIAMWSAGHGFCALTTTGALKDLPLAKKHHLRDVMIDTVITGVSF